MGKSRAWPGRGSTILGGDDDGRPKERALASGGTVASDEGAPTEPGRRIGQRW